MSDRPPDRDLVATGLDPLVSAGELSQATDDVGFCGVRERTGAIYLEPVTVGDRTFPGPCSVLRGGTRIGNDSLIGPRERSRTVPPSLGHNAWPCWRSTPGPDGSPHAW